MSIDINNFTPTGKIQNKHLLTLKDYSKEEICEILHLAKKIKTDYLNGTPTPILKGKTLAMIFAKSSTRTRLSFEMGMKQLGGDSLFLNSNDLQLGRNEPISDTAKVLSRYGIHGVMIRTFAQSDVEDLAKYGTIPVINGLTDDYHPCQALADVMTLYECFGYLNGLKVAYLGDGNNVATSLMIACAKLGVDISIVGPSAFAPNKDIVEYCRKFGNVEITQDIEKGVEGADAIYTDVFFSMGQAKDPQKEKLLMPYQVTDQMMKMTKKDSTIFLHCLPAHREEEVTASVIDGAQSQVFLQAENRMHAQKAVLALLL